MTVVRKYKPRRTGPLLGRMSKVQGDLLEQPPEPVAIGLDASLTNYGVVVYGMESGEYAAMLFRPKYKGARRLFEIWEMVATVVRFFETNYEVAEYALEGYSMGSKSRQHAIGEGGGATKLGLIMQYGGDERVAFPTLVPPPSLKKFATGKGNVDKSVVGKRVFQKWGVDIDDDNLVDGYVLSRIAAAVSSGITEYDYESDVISSLERNTEWEPLTKPESG